MLNGLTFGVVCAVFTTAGCGRLHFDDVGREAAALGGDAQGGDAAGSDAGAGSGEVATDAERPSEPDVSPGTSEVDAADVNVDACVSSEEMCDGVDNDCNGLVDDVAPPAATLCVGAELCAAGRCVAVPAEWACTSAQQLDHTYAICAFGVDRAAALANCTSVGAHLVTITSEAENQLVLALAQAGTADVWLGLQRAADCVTWEWDSGEPFRYQGWAAGYPDQGCRAKCAQLWRGVQFAWDDTPCTQLQSYICEWEPP